MATSKHVRVRLRFPLSTDHEPSWLYLDTSRTKTISDLAEEIKTKFSGTRSEEFKLTMLNFLLPFWESTEILQNGDVIRLLTVEKRSLEDEAAVSASVSKSIGQLRYSVKTSEKGQADSVNVAHDSNNPLSELPASTSCVAVDEIPAGGEDIKKKKKKKKQRRDNSEGCSESTTCGDTRSYSEKRGNSETGQLLEGHTSGGKRQKLREETLPVADISTTERTQCVPVVLSTMVTDSACSKSANKLDTVDVKSVSPPSSELKQITNTADDTLETTIETTEKPKKRRRRHRKRKSIGYEAVSDTSTNSTFNSPAAIKTSVFPTMLHLPRHSTDNQARKHKHFSASDNEDGGVAAEEMVVDGGITYNQSAEDFNHCDSTDVLKTNGHRNVSTSSHPVVSYPETACLSSEQSQQTSHNASETVTSSLTNGAPVYTRRRNTRKFHELSKAQQLKTELTNSSIVYKNPCAEGTQETKHAPDVKPYEGFPALTGPPRTGDKIAYKIIEMSESYCPGLSDYKEAVVIYYEAGSGIVTLQLSRPDKCSTVERRKFDVDVDDGDHVLTNREQPTSQVCLHWNLILEPRLLS